MFSGIHYRDGSVRESMGFGICTVLKCNSKTSDMCDSHVSSNQKLLNMSLHKMKTNRFLNVYNISFDKNYSIGLFVFWNIADIFLQARIIWKF